MPKISTVVITYNEEANIERCLKSVAGFSDEIVVVDSHSTDRTVEIAGRFGARVISNDWPGYGKQRQFAIENAKNEWVFSIDADEEVSPELCNEILTLDFSCDGYEVPRRVWYLDRWIKHGVWYPGYILRLFRKGSAHVTDDVVHESVRVNGRKARLHSDLLHYSYRDIEHHMEKMNQFTTISASGMLEEERRVGVSHIVFYPVLEFFKTYVAKRGFLDGIAGFEVSILHAFYVFLKYAKLREKTARHRKRGEDKSTPDDSAERSVEARR